MEDLGKELVRELIGFFENHFYEIAFIVLILAIIDVVFFILRLNKKDRVIILSASDFLSRTFGKLGLFFGK